MAELEIEYLGEEELSPDLMAKIERMTAEADAELDATRVNFRWGARQLQLVRHVAELMGVPYQTYMKQALLKQAAEDFQRLAPLLDAVSAPKIPAKRMSVAEAVPKKRR